MRLRDVCNSVCELMQQLLKSLLLTNNTNEETSIESDEKAKEKVEDKSISISQTENRMTISQLREYYLDDVVHAICSQEVKLRYI